MQKRYAASRRGLLKYVLLLAVLIPTGIIAVSPSAFVKEPVALLLLLFPVGLIAWTYLDTYYTIEQAQLRCKCAFISGRIDIQQIYSIQAGETMWTGLKPALATGGLIIRYGWYDLIYIAPERNDELITDLLAVKPTISISGQV